ncbi:EF-P 5-aminopentanol modification-associated protein YfmF [Symbiobacterium terraclitae]|uniref:EF-P 5-aminopentanol modification-associated protein YfmF n=1 Tax=Symbiobacterium terraclitae TaxID=557451 RepID=UPI0035B50C3D
MGDRFTRFPLSEGVNLYVQPTTKFKTTTIYVYFHMPLEPVTVTYNALLPMVLARASADFPTTAELSRHLDELYGASFSVDVARRGEVQSIVFQMEVAGEKHVPGAQGLLPQALDVLGGIITRPLLVGDGFKPEYVDQERTNLRQMIEGLINDKRRYAMVRCTAAMCEGEAFALHRLGRVEDLEGVTPASLLAHHRRVLTEAPVDIFVLGDVDPAGLREEVARRLPLPAGPRRFPDTVVKRGPDRAVKDVVDRLDVNQGVVVIGFRTGITLRDELYFPMLVANGVLGGFSHSKLFQEVREKNSLAYFAYSSIETVKGVGYMYAGVEFADAERCKAIMLEQLRAVQEGAVSDAEMETTIATLVNDMLSAADSPGAMAELAVDQVFSGRDLSIDDRVALYRRVTREQVAEAARHFTPDTVYMLTRREGGA